jgi:transcriptional regulator with XRE-family HTH domain
MEARELGRRLRLAREARGFSQQAVAVELGLPRTAITGLEAGNRSVSTVELTRLSELYLRPVADLLQTGARDEDEDVVVALLRAAPGLEQDSAMGEQVARCVSLCREGIRLERLLGAEPRSVRRATRLGYLASQEKPWHKANRPRNRSEGALASVTRPSPTSPI